LWGSDTIGMKLVSKYKIGGESFLKSFTIFKLTVYILISLPVLFYFYKTFDGLTFIYSVSVFLSGLFFVIDFYSIINESNLNSKFNVICNVSGLILSLMLRFIIVKFGMDIKYLSVPIILQGLVPLAFKYIQFNFINKKKALPRNINIKLIFYGIFSGFGLLISTVSVMIYLNIGRILISKYDNLSAVGIYSVALVLGTTWSFVSNSIITSLTPKLYTSSKDDSVLVSSLLNQLLVIIGFIYFILFFFFGKKIINVLYGESYLDAFNVALILIPVTILSGLGTVSARYIVSFGGYGYEAKKAIITAVISIFLSIFLIRIYGIYGAAWGALICESLSLTVLNYFYKNGMVLSLHKKSL
ncbi:polysaccharide biosynthesis C-terminal domain-containing protein, partial [Rosenbergiella collisarenosi]|uniref:oligosaccharide flippase family protein n=1 Tax=Rosenbergiella collisarenosi TaxID=1544695 RepID=UPI001F50055A